MKKSCLTILVCLMLSFISNIFAVEVTIWGPKQYSCTIGPPNVYTDTFPGKVGNGLLIIKNGTLEGSDRISSAFIRVNGQQILGTEDFNQNVYDLEIPIEIEENNTISIQLISNPKSYLTLEIIQDIEEGWAMTYGGNGYDYAKFINKTRDGGFIVAGNTTSFGPDMDIWIVKLLSNGNIEWQKNYKGSWEDYAYSISQTNDGGYIIACEVIPIGAVVLALTPKIDTTRRASIS